MIRPLEQLTPSEIAAVDALADMVVQAFFNLPKKDKKVAVDQRKRLTLS